MALIAWPVHESPPTPDRRTPAAVPGTGAKIIVDDLARDIQDLIDLVLNESEQKVIQRLRLNPEQQIIVGEILQNQQHLAQEKISEIKAGVLGRIVDLVQVRYGDGVWAEAQKNRKVI